MNELLLAQLMEVQGEIKVRLMKAGLMSEAHDLAADILDYIVQAPITKNEYQKLYAELP